MIYLDAIRIKIRENSRVINRVAPIAVGVDLEGIKHVLGIWVQDTEGSAFWAHICADLGNRGVRDVLVLCCDGLKALPEAIDATWPNFDGPNLPRPPDQGGNAVRGLRQP